MDALLQNRVSTFEGLGPSILTGCVRGELQRHPIPETLREARALLHDECPLTPGVYGWLDSRQQVCYIGKSKSLRKRLLTYFANSPVDNKALRIRRHSVSLVWEPCTDELLALIRETELIHRWRPEFNTQGQPTKRQPAFLCFSGGPAPNAYFTRRLTSKAAAIFGPIAGTGRLRAATEAINQAFQLRDCPDKTRFEFNNQQQLFSNPQTAGCIRYELGSCPAPCAGNCSKSDYHENVDAAVDFVRGGKSEVLKKLTDEMTAASLSQSFEKAAVLRDQHKNLSWLDRRMKALRSAKRNLNGIFPIPTVVDGVAWLILRRGRLVGSLAMPETNHEFEHAIEFLSQMHSQKEQLPETILEMHLQLLLISWFRKFPKLKKELIPFREGIARCRELLIKDEPLKFSA